MSSSERKAGGGGGASAAVGGKAARACDGCMRRRARWYCAADDAFLCQSCDTSVHSANPLARRHERLRLRGAMPMPMPVEGGVASETTMATKTATKAKRLQGGVAWAKRKARTRRPPVKSVGQLLLSRRLVVRVPDDHQAGAGGESSDEQRAAAAEDEEEQQLLYRVPVFDPALGEFCSPPPVEDYYAIGNDNDNAFVVGEDTNKQLVGPASSSSPVQELPDCFASFGPTDAELREFAADMEALLGGQDALGGNEQLMAEDSFYMEALGLVSPLSGDHKGVDAGRPVKVETDGGARRSSPPTLVDDDDGSFEHKAATASYGEAADAGFLKRSLDLRLNYEAVIEGWGSSPWTDGRRPHGGQLDDLLLHDHYYSGMWTADRKSVV